MTAAPSAILVFDAETGGLPQHHLPLDHPAQPQIVQLAAILEVDGVERGSFSVIIDQEGRPIPPDVAALHGIDSALAARCGIAIEAALGMWLRFAWKADLLVGHNVGFDIEILCLAFAALAKPAVVTMIRATPTACTQAMSDTILRLPPTKRMIETGYGNKNKPPKLSEAYRHFFGEDLVGAHDALVDVRACARVYRHIIGMQATTGNSVSAEPSPPSPTSHQFTELGSL